MPQIWMPWSGSMSTSTTQRRPAPRRWAGCGACTPCAPPLRRRWERGDLFVEEADGAVVGTGIFNRLQADVYAGAPWQYDAPDDQIMVLHTLAVDPQAGKRGLGRAFAAFYEQYAREHGCRYLRIDTNERTEALHASNDHRCWI